MTPYNFQCPMCGKEFTRSNPPVVAMRKRCSACRSMFHVPVPMKESEVEPDSVVVHVEAEPIKPSRSRRRRSSRGTRQKE